MEKNTFKKLAQEDVDFFVGLLGKDRAKVDTESRTLHSTDETEDLSFLPEIVLYPENTQEVSQIMKHCYAECIPVTPQGGQTGLCGGALPVSGGVALSMKRMNKILNIDTDNNQATVQPGVIAQNLMDEVEKLGLFYPIDPASKGSSFIGGNVAHGSGGPRVVKYGTIREYILNLEVVLANGEILETTSNTLKFSSGYNLTQLMIGSEGTLGIVTKVVVKLIVKPEHSLVMLGSFPSRENACSAVAELCRQCQGVSALEFMEKKCVDWVKEYDHIKMAVAEGSEAFLLIELSGNNLDSLQTEVEQAYNILENYQVLEVELAETAEQKEYLFRVRRTVPVSVKSNSIYKEEDAVVPRSKLPDLIKKVKEIGSQYGFESVVYGHAGDGNLHINIIKGDLSEEVWNSATKEGIKELFAYTVELGGTISGEHGIGWVQKEYLPIKFNDVHINLLKGIKQVFDPKNILNPSKIF